MWGWRNWLTQESYTFKIVGSSPTPHTMKQQISSYYKYKGYKDVYVITHKKDLRKIAVLRDINNKLSSTPYAKYLYTSYYKCDIDSENQVDHINGNKTDDRIENLQVISAKYNAIKDHKRKEMVVLTCPVCKEEFLFQKRNLSSHPNPCCSRKCGGIKSHW